MSPHTEPGAHQAHSCCGIIWLNYFYYTGEAELRKFLKASCAQYKNKAMALAALSSAQLPFMDKIFRDEGFAPIMEGNNHQLGPIEQGVRNNVILYGKVLNRALSDAEMPDLAKQIAKYSEYWRGEVGNAAVKREFGRGG